MMSRRLPLTRVDALFQLLNQRHIFFLQLAHTFIQGSDLEVVPGDERENQDQQSEGKGVSNAHNGSSQASILFDRSVSSFAKMDPRNTVLRYHLYSGFLIICGKCDDPAHIAGNPETSSAFAFQGVEFDTRDQIS
jgi:hypothetical protein